MEFIITKINLFKYIEVFTTKKWKLSDNKSDNFHISFTTYISGTLYDRLGKVILPSTHNLCFWAEISKEMYTPVNPNFTR